MTFNPVVGAFWEGMLADADRAMVLEVIGAPVRRVGAEDVAMHGADRVSYLPLEAQADLLAEPTTARLLTADDAAVFAQFEGRATESDRDDAFVELDHWAVVGAFAAEELVCAASAYPWRGSTIADLGVLTLPEHRGQGHARRVLRALSAHALREGHEPQHRCQVDNVASVALALAVGFELYALWDVSA